MNCSVCDKVMAILEGIIEMNGKRCHVSCKARYDEQHRKNQGLDRIGQSNN